MSKLIKYIILSIFLYFIYFYFPYYKSIFTPSNTYLSNKIEIGIFIISGTNAKKVNNPHPFNNRPSSLDRQRYIIDKYNWLDLIKTNKHPNIKIHILECNRDGIICQENYIPGIIEKTIQSFIKYNKYDYYIRTNLSSCWLLDRLYQYLIKIPRNKPVYYGTYCNYDNENNFFNGFKYEVCGGHSIIMNNLAMNILIKNYPYYKHIYMADDHLIGFIMTKHKVPIYQKNGIWDKFAYQWNFNKSINQNINYIRQKSSIFYIRKKTYLTNQKQIINYKNISQYINQLFINHSIKKI